MNFNHHKLLQPANKALADLCFFGLCVFKRFVAIKGGLRRGRYKMGWAECVGDRAYNRNQKRIFPQWSTM